MIVIKLSKISKSFNIYHEQTKTIFGTLVNILRGTRKRELFYALKNIDITIEKGETIGIIGENGSGKTTLLRLIAGILTPTDGELYVRGKVVPLIELGVGLQDYLTAKDNVFLYGAILGLKRKSILPKLQKILDFAGINKFADSKLRTFSSGMRVRLAFSIAKETNPDILLLDEIFAVGDKYFQKKSLKILQKFRKRNKTIIITSHDTNQLRHFCDRVILLHKGKLIMFDHAEKVLKYYESIKNQ